MTRRLAALPLLIAAALAAPQAASAAVAADALPPEQQATAPRLVVRTGATLTAESTTPLLPTLAGVAKASGKALTVTCTGAAGTRCTVKVFPAGTAARAAGIAPLGTGAAVVGPNGRASVRVKLTPAGRRALRGRRGDVALRGTAKLADGTSLPLAGSARLS